MFENLCTLPLSSELFAQALHPTEPILAVGLSGGHVQSFRLPLLAGSGSDDDDGNTSVLSAGTSTIDTEWKTKRHKGSCRTLAYSHDGEVLYSAGTDGLVKAASSATGQVQSKVRVPFANSEVDPPTLIHALSPQTLLLATDSAALHIYDLRIPGTFEKSNPSQTHFPHDDYVSSLTPLAPTEHSTSGFSKQWVTTGGTTLAVTDLRRGVLVKSEDQEEELLSSVIVAGLRAKPGRSKGEKVLVGNSTGVITLWEKGVWDDQDERIIIDAAPGGGESLDAMILMPEGMSNGGKNVVVGMGDGTIRIVKLGVNKLVNEPLRHDEVDGVVALGFDVGGRLISGGGSIVKVWQEQTNFDDEDEDSDSEEEETAGKRALESDDDNDDADSSEEEGQQRKKRKRSKGKSKTSGNGILKFKGLN